MINIFFPGEKKISKIYFEFSVKFIIRMINFHTKLLVMVLNNWLSN